MYMLMQKKRSRLMHTCDVSDLDTDALLPPRKRLLAGLRRQSPDVKFPIPSTSNRVGSEFDIRLNNCMKFQLDNPMSSEEIVEATKCVAIEAAKIAEIARANAEDKATKAAKAVAAAKSALDLVTNLSEKGSKNGNRLKKNKLKKHIPVESLYNRNKRKIDEKTDEKFARNLINSSSRISKNAGFEEKNKHALVKSSAHLEKKCRYSGSPDGEGDGPCIPTSNCKVIVEELDSDGSKLKSGEVDRFFYMDNLPESSDCLDKNRGRIKPQKKLPLSICTFKDKAVPKEPAKSKDAA